MSILPGSTRRRAAVAVAAAAAVLAASAVAAPPALADDAHTLTVVGTSDVFDSNLIQSVIKPDFEAAHPGVTLNYVSKGTGAAIAYAEQGLASALLVHAPSLENQFVAAGYSAEPAGRAFFWGDYVLLSQQADPAKVNKHDIAGAFEKVAKAGAAGKANFVSRGGTPGTTVQEHAIWALTTGVKTCDVSDANGGGESPSTTTGPCPTNISYPSWYHATGLTQGPNITNADSCNYTGGNCYVLTDRGTFNYLQSTGAAQSLHIVTRNNSKSARGGVAALVNSFHSYAINPDAFPSNVAANINEPLAVEFLNFVTSPTEQTAIGSYLNSSNDPPFIPDAAPRLTASAPPINVTGGKSFTLTGQLSNVVPGTPPLSGESVSLYGTDPSPTPVVTKVATATTNSAGYYSFRVTPAVTTSYQVRSDAITKVEYPTLDPPFSDMLTPQSTDAGTANVVGLVKVTSSSLKNGTLTVSGSVRPAASDNNAQITLYATPDGGTEQPVGRFDLPVGTTRYTVSAALDPGSYSYRVAYTDSPYINRGYSDSSTIDVP